MGDRRKFNQEQAELLFKKTKKDWLFNFLGVAGGVFLFLLGSIIGSATGREMWSLLTIPGMIVMAMPTFIRILRGASAKGFLNTGSIEISNVYENGYEEVDYTATNAINGGMAILKYGLMFFVSILLTPIALVTSTIKLVKINKAFGTAKPLLPIILDSLVIVAIVIGGIVMGSTTKAHNVVVKDDYKGQNDKKAELISGMKNYVSSHNHHSYYSYYESQYDKETKEYSFEITDLNSLKAMYGDCVLEGNVTYTINVETGVMKKGSSELDTVYSSSTLIKAQQQLKSVAPLVIIPFDHILADLDNTAIEKYDYQVKVKYVDSEIGQVIFTIGTSYYNGMPANSLWSFDVKVGFGGYSLKY